MSSIVLKTPFTGDENSLYHEQFRKLDKEELGIVTGEAVKPLFAASGLSAQLLSQIWALVDISNKGFLNFNEFGAALRVIGHLQQYPSLPVTADLYSHPSSRLPVLSTAAPAESASPTSNMSTRIPLISAQDVSKFSQLYDRASNGAPRLAGDKAKEIFLKARLPTQTLGEVWGLCDRNASGSLDKTEFIMAMYLIQLCMTNSASVKPLPPTLPVQLWSSIDSNSIPAAASPLSANSTGRSSLARQGTISRLSSGVFTNASTDWSLSMEKKQQFDAIFDSLDKGRAGSLSSQVLVPFFLSSRLNQETLASIWDLADIHNNAEFSKLEFAIAMFLIQKKNAGVDLPDVIPDQLLHSPALGLYQQPQPSQQNHMAIPSRDTKPSFREPPVSPPQQIRQNSTNGSLSDLLALNGSFASPAPPSQVHRSSSSFGQDSTGIPVSSVPTGYSSTGVRNLHSQPDWGHNVIKEDDEDLNMQQPPQPEQSAPPQPVQRNVVPQPVPRTSSVTLPTVPNFASLSLPVTAVGAALGGIGRSAHRNNDLYADGEASSQLSSATTEMANLSNQVNSLSKQATITNDKKTRTAQELKRVNEMKASIESKLATLRANHEQNVKQTEQMEADLTEVNRETEGLNQQLTVTEGNYHAVESRVAELTQDLQEAQQKNAQLKEQISGLNSMSATLQAQLSEKQQQIKQERSMVDVNSKQLEMSQITVANFEQEIQGLGEKLDVYLTKRKELDDYQKTVEEQHSQLQAKYQELESKNVDLTTRSQELDDRSKQIEEQEAIYEQHVARLQAMFDDLSKRKESFDRADEELKNQHFEYANKVQDLSERQMKLAMGELPHDAKIIIAKSRDTSTTNYGFDEEQVSKFVDDTVANSKLGTATNDDEDRAESDVFDKDVPTVGSQTEADDVSEAAGHANETERAENLADRFEGDLNEYGIPRTQSLTSSVANNAPQSVIDDIELPETLEERTIRDKDTTLAASQIPGHWEGPLVSTAGTVQPEAEAESSKSVAKLDEGNRSNEHDHSNSPSNNSINHSAVMVDPNSSDKLENSKQNNAKGKFNSIDEEFPPIKELDINESESSSDDDFQDTREEIVPTARKNAPIAISTPAAPVVVTPAAAPLKDEFDDAFDGLEQAAVEEGHDSADDEPHNDSSMEEFEKIDHRDLDDELQQNAFTGSLADEVTSPAKASVPDQNAANTAPESDSVSNDEWDEIFAGFGNSKRPTDSVVSNLAVQQPIPVKNETNGSSSPINRKVATTPKSLAVEELSGMGFTEEEAVNALETCKWDLEAATNHLLDSA